MPPSRDGRSRNRCEGGSRQPDCGPRRAVADGCLATLVGSQRGRHDYWTDSGHAPALPHRQRRPHRQQRRVGRRLPQPHGIRPEVRRCGPATALQEVGCGTAAGWSDSASAGGSRRDIQEIVHLAGRRPGAGVQHLYQVRLRVALPRQRPPAGRAAAPAPSAGRVAGARPARGPTSPPIAGERPCRGRRSAAAAPPPPRRRHRRHRLHHRGRGCRPAREEESLRQTPKESLHVSCRHLRFVLMLFFGIERSCNAAQRYSRTISTSLIFGSNSPPAVRSTVCQVNEFWSIGLMTLTIEAFRPSAR